MELLDDNGRFENLSNVWSLFMANPVNLLIGVGFGSDAGSSPHNSIIETVTRSGFGVAIILLIGAFALLLYLKGSEYIFPVLALFAGSLVYSGFYAVKAFTIVALISIVCHAFETEQSKTKTLIATVA